MEDMHLWRHRNEPPTMLQPELLKWRDWKRSALKDEEPTAQRGLEVHLGSPDFHTELTHLLRNTAFRTLRQYCLAYEGLRGFALRPSRVFGLLNIDEVHRLKAKKQAFKETLADTATKPQHKAVVPSREVVSSREVVWALKEGAATLDPAGLADQHGLHSPDQEAPSTVNLSQVSFSGKEETYMKAFAQSRPRLEHQGSDALLKRQVNRGEPGFIPVKYLVSALLEEGERPTKTTKRFTLDGWEGQEEEEIRANPTTPRQLERMHMVFRTNLLMCLASVPQFANLAITKQELDDWYDWFYGEDIAGR
eukprot:s366_g35.t1